MAMWRILLAVAAGVSRCSGDGLRGQGQEAAAARTAGPLARAGADTAAATSVSAAGSAAFLDLRRVALLRGGASVAVSVGGDDTVWSEMISSLDNDDEVKWTIVNASRDSEDGPSSGAVILWAELVQTPWSPSADDLEESRADVSGVAQAVDRLGSRVSFWRPKAPGGIEDRVITDGERPAAAPSGSMPRPALSRASGPERLRAPVVLKGLEAFRRWSGGERRASAVYLTGWADRIAAQDWSEEAQEKALESVRGFDTLVWAEGEFRSDGFTALIPRWLRLGGKRQAVVFTRPEQLKNVKASWSALDAPSDEALTIVSVGAADVAAALQEQEHALRQHPLADDPLEQWAEAVELELRGRDKAAATPPRRRDVTIAGIIGVALVISAFYEMYCWRPEDPREAREPSFRAEPAPGRDGAAEAVTAAAAGVEMMPRSPATVVPEASMSEAAVGEAASS